jgi:dihydroflavonol-4-reductase
VSTANVFGPGSKENPGSESAPFTLGHYKSGYINSKYMAQEYVLKNVNEYNLNAVVVNPTFIIGPYDSKPSSGKMILHGLKHGIQWYPSGGKNFVNVHDVAQGIIRALEIGRNGQCYLLAGENLTYREFFSQLNQVSGRKPIQIKVPKVLIRFAGEIADVWSNLIRQPLAFNKSNAQLLCLDNYYTDKKAAQEFGLQTTPVKSGIEEALTWFRKENYISEDNYSTQGTSFDL